MKGSEKNYAEVNKHAWNERLSSHLTSSFYDNEGFVKGRSSLNDIELEFLKDIKGKSILHLQCHFGQDTLSLARMGAQVTGVDISDKAIETARGLSEKINVPASFVCCDVYDLPKHLDAKFDMVFTSYGTIGWLPDLDKWAVLISHFLKPGGKLVFVEFHPFVWMYDNALEKIEYSYFKSDAIVENESGTYADKSASIAPQTITWNHALSEVINALIGAGLNLELLKEYDHSPYNVFPGMEKVGENKHRIVKFGDKLPLVYALIATNIR